MQNTNYIIGFQVLFESNYWVVRDMEGNYYGHLYSCKKGAIKKAIECFKDKLI
jgi:hypothetical protein